MNSFGSRVSGTVIIGVCWIVFIILFFAFFAGNFNLWQNLAISIASIIISAGIIGAMWAKWALE